MNKHNYIWALLACSTLVSITASFQAHARDLRVASCMEFCCRDQNGTPGTNSCSGSSDQVDTCQSYCSSLPPPPASRPVPAPPANPTQGSDGPVPGPSITPPTFGELFFEFPGCDPATLQAYRAYCEKMKDPSACSPRDTGCGG